MPNGFTADLYEGKDTSLRSYLMGVARGMGYSIMQRDDAPDAPVREVTASDYNRRRADELRAELAEIEGLSVADAWDRYKREREEAGARRDESVRGRREMRERYLAMLAEVEAWQPDPLIASTKTYALKYLHESMEFDCGPEGQEARYWPMPEHHNSGADYITARRRALQEQIDRAEKVQAEEEERTRDRNRHIRALHASLPPAPIAGHIQNNEESTR